jgi:DNA (cytosine-5)-methyltransferase 1
MALLEQTASPAFIVFDLFCGFGGTTTGYTDAEINGQPVAYVAACINHDPLAIESHWSNHPDVEHFNENIKQLYGQIVGGLLLPSYQFVRLKRILDLYRAFYPNAKVILWASLECTNFSKAKGGMSRDPDSRTLAHHLNRYIQYLQPDYIKIENVVEFMAWGPLMVKTKKDKNGYEYSPLRIVKTEKTFEDVWGEYAQYLEPPRKTRKGKKSKKPYLIEHHVEPHLIPVSTKNGEHWLKWREHVCSLGYRDEWKQLNSANYGAYTSRNRLFGIFAKPNLPIVWPEATHAKKSNRTQPTKKPKTQKAPGLFDDQPGSQPLQTWKAVRDVLDFTDQGESIILRKKSLEPKSLERIYAGLVKFVAHGDTSFLTKYFSGTPSSKNISVDGPSGALTRIDHHAFVQTEFMTRRHDGDPNAKIFNFDRSRQSPAFLTHYYSSGGLISSIDEPCTTITRRDGKSIIQCDPFLDRQFGKSQNQSIHVPAGTLLPNDKHRLITTDPFLGRHHYLVNPSWGGHPGSIDNPCPVIVARGDKAPLYLIQVEEGSVAVAVYTDDSPIMVKIKQFMAAYGLVDIKMRMLRVKELLKIQGFPENYKMVGNQGDRKKFIGNSVVPLVVKAWAEILAGALRKPEYALAVAA